MGYLPVDRCMVVCRCLCPSTRNCGSSTSFEMPTDCRPEFHLYRISRIVYPTAGKEQEHKNLGSNIQYILDTQWGSNSLLYRFLSTLRRPCKKNVKLKSIASHLWDVWNSAFRQPRIGTALERKPILLNARVRILRLNVIDCVWMRKWKILRWICFNAWIQIRYAKQKICACNNLAFKMQYFLTLLNTFQSDLNLIFLSAFWFKNFYSRFKVLLWFIMRTTYN